MKQRSIVRVGHRGAAGHAPENTVAAIDRGIALGAEFVEFDLQRTRDGRIVLMHDKRIERTTNGRGRVADFEWEELRKFDAGEGQRIPLLEEALEAIQGRAGAILECIAPGLGEAIWHGTVEAGFSGPAIFASFLHREIRAIRELDPEAMTMALLEGVPIAQSQFAIDAGATHAGLALDSATATFVNALHDAQLQVFVYTADTTEQIDLAIQMGADGIISNFPDRLQRQ